jgi:hypothetical protein
MITLLGGAVLGVLIFSALIWSIYRAVVTNGFLRINAIVLTLGTLLGMAGLTYQNPIFIMIAAPACLLFGLAQMMTDPRWSKLLPLMQFLLGFVLFNVLLYSGP